MKNILITGISGFIGNYLHKFKPNDVQITGTFQKNNSKFSGIDLVEMNLSKVDEFIIHNKQKFDIVIHCAAEASLAECEKNPEDAFILNSKATKKLANWSGKQKSRFVFFSSDIVFDGERGNYFEEDIPHPVNIYGKSKLEAEQAISKIHNNAVIVRLALCLGRGLGNTKSFIDWFYEKLENDEPLSLYYDEYRTPVSAVFAAKTIWEIANSDFSGVVHLTGKEKINRYNLGVKILRHLKWDKHHLLVKESSNNSIYPRPRDVSINSNFLENVLKIKRESITELIENII